MVDCHRDVKRGDGVGIGEEVQTVGDVDVGAAVDQLAGMGGRRVIRCLVASLKIPQTRNWSEVCVSDVNGGSQW